MAGSSTTVQELQIPVPWGHIAAKAWGDEADPIVLCFHGIMDNAASFDRLVELLPKLFYYISVDLPSHGKSSRFPPHLPIHSINYILVFKILVKYFKRKRYTILGHSYGGQLGLIFAQIHPESVENIIMLDTVTIWPVPSENFAYHLSNRFDAYLKFEERPSTKKQPTYTYDEALNRLITGRNYQSLTVPAARALLERCIEPTEDGRYIFTTDSRLKCCINPLRDFRYITNALAAYPVRCPILIILSSTFEAQQIYMRPVIAALSEWHNVKFEYIKGTHDVHITHPERVAPLVDGFLTYKKGKGKL